MTLAEQLTDPSTRREYKLSADSFFESGRRDFNSGKFGSAEFYLGIAGRIYHGLNDKFTAKMVQGWFVSAVKRNTNSNYREQLPDWCQ